MLQGSRAVALFLALHGRLPDAGPGELIAAVVTQAGRYADLALLGAVLVGPGRYADAESVLHRALDTWRRRFGSDHYEVAVSVHTFAVMCQRRGQLAEALAAFTEAMRIKTRVLGPDHPESRPS